MDYPELAGPLKGRGAVTNRSGRFEPESRETVAAAQDNGDVRAAEDHHHPQYLPRYPL